jgi:hypothetical protein
MGLTASGKPWYKHAVHSVLTLYFDPSCDGSSSGDSGNNKWLLDDVDPSETALSNLSGGEECRISGRSYEGGNKPSTGRWNFICDGSWTDISVKIEENEVREGGRTNNRWLNLCQ